MKGLINKVITFYEMRATALSVLVTNTERALKEFAPNREEKANEQVKKRLKEFDEALTETNNACWIGQETRK